jgi:CheY-like chemotaxis protein
MFGLEPVTWQDGAAALIDFENREFGLIFMDVHMPSISGLELTGKIRELEAETGRPRTPIVALTASAMPHELEECRRRDMDAVLPKPFRLDAMRQVLSKWSILDPIGAA